MILASGALSTSSASTVKMTTEPPTTSIQKTTRTKSTILTMTNNGTSGTTSVPSSTITVGVSSNDASFANSITGDENLTQAGVEAKMSGTISINIFIGISQAVTCIAMYKVGIYKITGMLCHYALHLSFFSITVNIGNMHEYTTKSGYLNMLLSITKSETILTIFFISYNRV